MKTENLTKAEAVEAMQNGNECYHGTEYLLRFKMNKGADGVLSKNGHKAQYEFNKLPNDGWSIYQPEQPDNRLNITKGVAEVKINTSKEYGVRNSGGYLCFLPKPTHYQGQDERYEQEMAESKANTHLIAEAFNVFNETGLTPKQLNEQLETGANQYAKVVADYSELAEQNERLTLCLKSILFNFQTNKEYGTFVESQEIEACINIINNALNTK